MSFGSQSLPPPTAEQKARSDAARALGCVACLMLGLPRSQHCGRIEEHHLLVAGLRAGHRYTVMLGEHHHRGEIRGDRRDYHTLVDVYGPSLKFAKGDFHAKFGTDQALLNYQDDLIGYPRVTIPSRRELRKSGDLPERKTAGRDPRKASPTASPSKIFKGFPA